MSAPDGRRPLVDSPPRTDIPLPTLLLAMLLSAGLWIGLYWLWRTL